MNTWTDIAEIIQDTSAIEKVHGLAESICKIWDNSEWYPTQQFLHGAAMAQLTTDSELFRELVFLRDVWFEVKH